MLVDVPKCKKAMMFLMEKIDVLDELCSGMSYSSVDLEVTVNASIIYIEYDCLMTHNTG